MKYVIELLNDSKTKVYANKAAAIAALDDYAYHRPGQPVVVIYKKDSDRTALIAIGVSNGLGEDDGSPSGAYKRPSDSKRYIIIGECEASNSITTTLSADQIVLRYIDYSNLITEINGKHGPGQFHDGVDLKDSTNFQGHFGYLNAEEGCFTSFIPDGTTVQAAFEAILCGKMSNPNEAAPLIEIETNDEISWDDDDPDTKGLTTFIIRITNFNNLASGIKSVSITTSNNIVIPQSIIDAAIDALKENGTYICSTPGSIIVSKPGSGDSNTANISCSATTKLEKSNSNSKNITLTVNTSQLPKPTITPPSRTYSALFTITISKGDDVPEGTTLTYKLGDGSWQSTEDSSVTLSNQGSDHNTIKVYAKNVKGSIESEQVSETYTYAEDKKFVDVHVTNGAPSSSHVAYNENAEVTVTINANQGYKLPFSIDSQNISINGINRNAIIYTLSNNDKTATLEFIMPNRDVSIDVTAENIPVTVTYYDADTEYSKLINSTEPVNQREHYTPTTGNKVRYADTPLAFYSHDLGDIDIQCVNCKLKNILNYNPNGAVGHKWVSTDVIGITDDVMPNGNNIRHYTINARGSGQTISDDGFAFEIKID